MPTVYKLRDLETGAPYLVLPGVVTIGRHEDADIQLAHDSVSRRHAKIHNTDSGVYVQDVGSSNGTYIMSQLITETTPVVVGTEITFGSLRLRLDPEVGAAGTADEPIPRPSIDWEKLQRGTSKISVREPVGTKIKTSTSRVSLSESGHLVTVQSAAFPGGAMFPKVTKSTKTTTGIVAPPPAPVVPRTGGMPLEMTGSHSAQVPVPRTQAFDAKWIFVFLAGMGVGIIVGLVLARVLFVR